MRNKTTCPKCGQYNGVASVKWRPKEVAPDGARGALRVTCICDYSWLLVPVDRLNSKGEYEVAA